jgi:hypothetical protein
MEAIKVHCTLFSGSNFMIGVGGLFGSFQKGYPSFVLASNG